MSIQRKIMFNLLLIVFAFSIYSGSALALTFTFNRAIPSPDTNVFAIGYGDDGFLWAHSQDSKIIYKLNPLTGSIIQRFNSNVDTINDLDVRGGILYGAGEPEIFRYNTSTGEQMDSLPGPVIGGSRGLTFVGTDLYVSGVIGGLDADVSLGRVDPLTGHLRGFSEPPDLVWSSGVGAIGQNVGYLVQLSDEPGVDVILYVVDPGLGNLIESHVLFQGDPSELYSLDSSNTELFVSRRDLDQIWVYDIGFPAISGCIKLKGLPLVNSRVDIDQPKKGNQTTTTDANGCYKFDNAVSGKNFRVIINGPVVP